MQKRKAYVGFKNGELHTERVHDGHGVFDGFTVYHDWSAAATRYDDVREVELRIGGRCVQMKWEPGKPTQEEWQMTFPDRPYPGATGS